MATIDLSSPPPLLSGLTYPHRILARGYSIEGDANSGYKATIPYFVRWDQTFLFVDDLMSGSSATTQGGAIVYKRPHKLPYTVAPLYCRSFKIDPCGVGTTDPESMEYLGLKPGEYYKYSKVTATYQTPDAPPSTGDYQLQQLDPANPLTVCRQSVRSAGKMETLKSGSYLWDTDSKPVPADFAIPTCESILTLEFPEIPYLPWQFIRPFINKINSAACLGVGTGELLLEAMDTKQEFTTAGYTQMLVLSFAATPTSGVTWNHLPRDGVPTLVKRKGDTSKRIFESADFTTIFNALERS